MSIQKTKLANCLLVLPNENYFLGQVQADDDFLKVVRTFNCAGLATVYITAIGAFGFMFSDSGSLASIDALRFSGSGLVPQKVIENEKEIHDLHGKRVSFVNFIAAAFFGRISAKKLLSLTGALYNGHDKFTNFYLEQDTLCVYLTKFIGHALEEKLNAFDPEKYRSYILEDSEIDDAILYIYSLSRHH